MKSIFVFQHAPHEGLGRLETYFRQAGLEWRYFELFREVPTEIPWQAAAGLVILGGPMNVDEIDRYPFLAQEVPWIQAAVVRGLPLLGLCLGSQLLAKAFGARVYPNRVKEIGWYEIELTAAAASDPLLAGAGPRETVFQWHGDTFDLPDAGVLLASSPQCRHQAIRVGPSAWGFQFHVEMTAELVERWLGEPGNESELDGLDYIDPREIRRGIPPGLEAMRRLGDRVLDRFATLCR